MKSSSYTQFPVLQHNTIVFKRTLVFASYDIFFEPVLVTQNIFSIEFYYFFDAFTKFVVKFQLQQYGEWVRCISIFVVLKIEKKNSFIKTQFFAKCTIMILFYFGGKYVTCFSAESPKITLLLTTGKQTMQHFPKDTSKVNGVLFFFLHTPTTRAVRYRHPEPWLPDNKQDLFQSIINYYHQLYYFFTVVVFWFVDLDTCCVNDYFRKQ